MSLCKKAPQGWRVASTPCAAEGWYSQPRGPDVSLCGILLTTSYDDMMCSDVHSEMYVGVYSAT
eukprot:scaffold190442_cov31-Prasinocladus_malaysianus.AAC.1